MSMLTTTGIWLKFKQERGSNMHPEAKDTDICLTCNHAIECVHYQNCRKQGKTIFHCENFDNKPVLTVVENEGLNEAEHIHESSKPGVSYVQGRMEGLCINCEKRISCRYPIREGGVWHCEEYC